MIGVTGREIALGFRVTGPRLDKEGESGQGANENAGD